MEDGPFVATLRAQWLGDQLRQLRSGRGMTLAVVAEQVGRPAAVLDRYERAEWPWRLADVTALLDLYGLHTPASRERLLVVAENVWRRNRWVHNPSDTLDGWFITPDWLTGRASRVCMFWTTLPGEFAGELPVPVEVIATEHALRWQTTGQTATPPHLSAIADLAHHPRVKVRILPENAGPGLESGGGFTLYWMPTPYPPVAHVDGLTGSLYVEEPLVARYTDAYERLIDLALSVMDSAELITTLTGDHVDLRSAR